MAPVLNADNLVNVLRDRKVIEALADILLPCIQAAVQSAVQSAVQAAVGQFIGEAKSRIDHLEMENSKLQQQIHALEQYNRLENVIVFGLPETFADVSRRSLGSADATHEESSNSVCETQFIQLCQEKLGVAVSVDDICTAHRLPKDSSVQGPRPMIVRFNNRRIRRNVMAARKKLREYPNCKIYINEHLTQRNSKILAEARKMQKEKRIAGAWTYSGKVYIKKLSPDGSQPETVLINSLEDLSAVV